METPAETDILWEFPLSTKKKEVLLADSPFDELSTYLAEKFHVWTKLPRFIYPWWSRLFQTLWKQYTLHEAYKEHSELWSIPNADHVQGYSLNKEEYTRRVVQFFDK